MSTAGSLCRRQANAERVRQDNRWLLFNAFTETAMLDNAPLVVWTKSQMRGVRAFLLRTRKC